MTVRNFIKDLGGANKVAGELGLPRTTVWSWIYKDSVPAWRVGKLAELAIAKGKPVPEGIGG